MAHVIPFSALRPGMTVWLEWRGSPYLLRMEIVEQRGDKGVRAKIDGEMFNDPQPVHDVEGRRVWDERPTKEESEAVPWTIS